MRINYNISSIIARNALQNNDTRLSASIERLSSGLKINSAADDAAGLAISRKMSAQIKSLDQANKNANDGLSVVNTADGAMGEMHAILQRMNELAIQSANGTNANSDREQIQLEIDQLVAEIDRIADTTQFNAQNLLDGSFAYKGYTNTENIKVKSYGDGVANGTYLIGTVTYNHYEDYTIYEDKDKIAKKEKRIEAENPENIKNALMTDADLEAQAAANPNIKVDEYKGFPDTARVILDDEDIIIKANNEFEIKLTMNNREALKTTDSEIANTTTSSVSYKTYTYHNIAVLDENGSRYNISNISYTEEDSKWFSGSKEIELKNLKEDFEELFKDKYPSRDLDDIEITGFGQSADGFTMSYKVNGGNVENISLKLYQDKDELGNTVQPQKELNDYLYSTTDTVKTTYTIGGNSIDEAIKLDMTGMGAMCLQVGANEGQEILVEIPALNAIYLGVDNLDISTEETATAAIDIIGDAINFMSAVRAKIGAYANRIEHTITNLDTTEENMTASYSRIMDVDMAEEMTEYSTVQVLVESSTAMLAQANERPQSVLQLLQ